jgi:hypothetical protein
MPQKPGVGSAESRPSLRSEGFNGLQPILPWYRWQARHQGEGHWWNLGLLGTRFGFDCPWEQSGGGLYYGRPYRAR